jgi:hypothetical protein
MVQLRKKKILTSSKNCCHFLFIPSYPIPA